MYPLQDTIVAISTPLAASPCGVVRVSGPAINPILRDLFCQSELQPRRLVQCLWSVSPRHQLPILATRFRSPRSFTGQDVLELQLPGHPALLGLLVKQLIAGGYCRAAEPGEFTYRALVHGKLDLTQAEGIAASIAAQSDAQLRAARELSMGHLGHAITQFTDQLTHPLALIEAAIDFTDQDDVRIVTSAELFDSLQPLYESLTHLLQQSPSVSAFESLPKVVLAGPPSSGKSTLFNNLLGRPRSLISSTPGTTRDVLVEPLTLISAQGQVCEILLVDIAGLDDPLSLLDRHAQAAAQHALAHADLILLIHDQRGLFVKPPTPTHSSRIVHIRSKADLPAEISSPASVAHDLAVSSHTGQGLDELRQLIVKHLANQLTTQAQASHALLPRHRHALEKAQLLLREVVDELQSSIATHNLWLAHPELIAASLRTVIDELGTITGRLTSDDLLGRVFAKFCIGK